MMLTMLHSKLHRARVTHSEISYNGSIGIDKNWLERTGILAGQQVDVLNVNNGERFTTYAIEAPAGSKNISVFGAAAHLVDPDDLVIIIAYAQMTPEEAKNYKPVVLIMDENNNVVENA
ncbi:MAG: aspartate 1-decarboxylase [Rickettsiales bacterium]|jgi:aspartate 1-decarboxylase